MDYPFSFYKLNYFLWKFWVFVWELPEGVTDVANLRTRSKYDNKIAMYRIWTKSKVWELLSALSKKLWRSRSVYFVAVCWFCPYVNPIFSVKIKCSKRLPKCNTIRILSSLLHLNFHITMLLFFPNFAETTNFHNLTFFNSAKEDGL